MADVQTQASIGDLLRDLSRETATLLRQQMELARVELSQRLSGLGRDLGMIVIGGALATGGLLSVIAGVVLAVTAMGVAAWVSALLVGIAIAAVGYAVCRRAIVSIGREPIVPQATIQTLKESAEWARNPTRT